MYLFCLLAALLFLPPAVAGEAWAASAPVPVLVSIPPQKYFVERIGGERVRVTVLVDKNRDPHSYEPTASQMANAHNARLYFAVGVPFEQQWLPRIQALAPDMTVVRHSRSPLAAPARQEEHDGHGHAHEGRKHEHDGHGHAHEGRKHEHDGHGHAHDGRKHEHDGHGHAHDGPKHVHDDDPHTWVSPRMVMRMLPEIRDALSKADPAGTGDYERNCAAFVEEVRALDARITALFAPIPEEKRFFLSLHEGWAYYAAAFGLHELTVELDGKEPGPKSMAAIIKEAEEHKVTTVVVDISTSNTTAAALQENLRVRLIRVNALEENWPDFLWRFSSALAQSLSR